MDFDTMSALVRDRQSTLRRDGEHVRRGRLARLRRMVARQQDGSPADSR
jgi:hypothetical protein